MSNSKRVL